MEQGRPRTQASANAILAGDVSTAWRVLADHGQMAGWAPGIQVTVDESTAVAAGGVGAVRRIKAAIGPAIVEEITAFEAPNRLTYRGVSGIPFRDYGGEVLLSEHPDGVRATWTLSAHSRMPLIERAALALLARSLLALYCKAVRSR